MVGADAKDVLADGGGVAGRGVEAAGGGVGLAIGTAEGVAGAIVRDCCFVGNSAAAAAAGGGAGGLRGGWR